jgi:CDP-diacylglycerol--glycerol-3-phosphate 3-phosphatidyltransferase
VKTKSYLLQTALKYFKQGNLIETTPVVKAVIPNIITLSRIFLLPLTFWLIFEGFQIWGIALFFWLMFSDFIDGKLARRWNVTSSFGALWDPIADKLLVMSFFCFFYVRSEIPIFLFGVMVTRDLCQLLCIPTLLHGLKIKFKVKPIFISKLSTAVNLLLIMFLLLSPVVAINDNVLVGMMILSLGLGLITAIRFYIRFYLIATKRHDTFD